MRTLSLVVATAVGLFASVQVEAGIVLAFGALPNSNSEVKFVGNGSQSTMTLTNSFSIISSNGVGDAVGKTGQLIGGFTYVGSDIQSLGGPFQTVALTGSGVLQFDDGAGFTLSAEITGVELATFGTGAGINFNGRVNLSNIQYGGSNQDFVKFLQEASPPGGGIATISITFDSVRTLHDLLSGENIAGYDGRLTTVPEPGNLAMAFTGIALLGAGCYRRRSSLLS